MGAFHIRPVGAADFVALGHFERDNRQAFEAFNEPRSNAHYSQAGITRAFHRLLAEQCGGAVLTRVVVAADETGWLAKGSLSVQGAGGEAFALLDYQTDRLHWRRGAATLLVKALLREAGHLGVPRLVAHVSFDNLVSLHLLRRAGFQATGWAEPARLRRGTVDCLELSRLLRSADGAALSSAHMHLPA
ncbi:GNAT family N-acetyltransferase [Hydrogenophaga sp.]|uniref:GNAT family N-acetyltransferase n=1 Tax=Hydrogenophaga sp. TaxID=1904254 RepID=UPI0027317429|nr:GNAT family protein [Hydrogenophaga sp.]MDP2072906.1 GNAT family protein [Hydrogenophaga sp.]MDP3110147.1 GNAT family protein [Hydrogenophaga sp.]MDZ4400834.1 GNAT family protein [Hydrogenophaga sp.]